MNKTSKFSDLFITGILIAVMFLGLVIFRGFNEWRFANQKIESANVGVSVLGHIITSDTDEIGWLTIDRYGEITAVSQWLISRTNYSASEMVGKTVGFLMPANQSSRHRKDIIKASRSTEIVPNHTACEIVGKDNLIIPVVVLMVYDPGQGAGVALMVDDDSEAILPPPPIQQHVSDIPAHLPVDVPSPSMSPPVRIDTSTIILIIAAIGGGYFWWRNRNSDKEEEEFPEYISHKEEWRGKGDISTEVLDRMVLERLLKLREEES